MEALAHLRPKADETQQHDLIVRHDLLDRNQAGCHHALKACKLFVPAVGAQRHPHVPGGDGALGEASQQKGILLTGGRLISLSTVSGQI